MTAISSIVSFMFNFSFGMAPLIALVWLMRADDVPEFELNLRGLRAFLRKALPAMPRLCIGLMIRCVLLWLVLSVVALLAASYGRAIELWIGIVIGVWIIAYILLLFDAALDYMQLPVGSVIGIGAIICAVAAPHKLTPYMGLCFGMCLTAILCQFAFYWMRELVLRLPLWRRS